MLFYKSAEPVGVKVMVENKAAAFQNHELEHMWLIQNPFTLTRQ